MPKLKNLDLQGTGVELIGGKVVLALASGRLLCLEDLGVGSFSLDSEGLGDLASAVRRGRFPSCLGGGMTFELSHVGQAGKQALIGVVVKSEGGMSWFEWSDKLYLSRTEALPEVGAASLGNVLPPSGLKVFDINLSMAWLSVTDKVLGRLGETVRAGAFVGVSSLDLSGNWNVELEAWRGFMKVVGESKTGMPKLKFLNLRDTLLTFVGGPISFALASGKVPSLEDIGTSEKFYFYFDEKGVGDLGNAVRTGGFPTHFGTKIKFQLNNSFTNLDGLILAIRESEGGLPSFVVELNLLGGRFGKEALASLAASGGRTSGGKLAHLKVLNLSSCAIDADQLGSLGQMFFTHDCRELESLNLKGNWISTQGVRFLFDLLTP